MEKINIDITIAGSVNVRSYLTTSYKNAGRYNLLVKEHSS